MKISLITPCLNAVETIDRTLQSVAEQQYPDLEYLIYDGGSTDGTLEVVDKYRSLLSGVVSEADKNVADALNKGFRRSSGEIRAYLNADDCLTPGALCKVAQIFSEFPDVDVVTGGCRRVFADGSWSFSQVPDRYYRVMSLRNDLEQPSTFWRTRVHLQAGEFDDSFYLAFDWEWWNRLKVNGARFMTTSDILSVYYFSDTNLTSRGGMRVIDEMHRITKMYGPPFAALAYKVLFRTFDLRGYYDMPLARLPDHRRRIFLLGLRALSAFVGQEVVSNYNWNWASKQVRNMKWY